MRSARAVQQMFGVLESCLFVIVDNRRGLGAAIFERCRIYFRALVLDLKLALREGCVYPGDLSDR
jgi:hypothetical protein